MSNSIRRARQRLHRARYAGAAAALCVAAGLALTVPALADSVDDFAKRLASLRSDVETLSARLSALSGEQRDELRSLARQKADLELELKKEEVRVAKLDAALGEKRAAIQADTGRDAQIAPLFARNLQEVRKQVASGLPFRIQERLAELDKLEEQLRTGLLTPPRALSRLWTFVEDEFRLSRENGLYQQTITVDGQEHLADVVRVGTVALFFKTNDGTVGHAVRRGGGYQYQVVSEPDAKKQIATVFDNFRKQIRAGYFELPNALGLGAAPAAAAEAP